MMRASALVMAVLLSLAAPAAAGSDGLELHVLDCGTMNGMDTESFLPEDADRPGRFDMVNRCFLVVHPKGTLLWDAGLPTGFSFRMMAWGFWLMTFGQSDIEQAAPLTEQLEAIGMSAADIDYVAFSHVHFDHVGQAADFSHATWIVQKVERDWVFDPELDNDSVFPSLIEPLEGSQTVELAGDHDVFGDGSVRILSSPGHTPGHQCLFLDLPETGRVVLSGDLYHSTRNRALRAAPSFNTDQAQSARSMERIERWLDEHDATLWIQHSPESGVQAPAHLR